MANFKNPFKPGAGHEPPYLAGRESEKTEFLRLLEQETILENVVLTGLRGVGKTVLLDTFKPLAMRNGWLWVGTDLSEAATLSELNIANRICTDLATLTSGITVGKESIPSIGFTAEEETRDTTLNYNALLSLYNDTPGLSLDKLKVVIETAVQALLTAYKAKGVIFAYDEAQNLSDQAEKDEYPLSLLLDTFQSIQKKDIPAMLVLTGLPTLFPKLVDSRTFAERMFRVIFLDSLTEDETRDAILKPIQDDDCSVVLSDISVDTIYELSGGYPYFIQFICREVYDAFIQKVDRGETASVPVIEIEQKLDSDFFAGRWSRATDRQRELLGLIADIEGSENEFTVQEVVDLSKEKLEKPFSSSHTSQMFATLINHGLLFKNRHGKYSFAVPLMGPFIKRQKPSDAPSPD